MAIAKAFASTLRIPVQMLFLESRFWIPSRPLTIVEEHLLGFTHVRSGVIKSTWHGANFRPDNSAVRFMVVGVDRHGPINGVNQGTNIIHTERYDRLKP